MARLSKKGSEKAQDLSEDEREALIDRLTKAAAVLGGAYDNQEAALVELEAALAQRETALNGYERALQRYEQELTEARQALSETPADTDLAARVARLEQALVSRFSPPVVPTPTPEAKALDADGSGEDGTITTTADTLFSVAAAPVLAARREALEAGQGRSRYADRLDAAVSAFVEIVGDRPLRSYVPNDLQVFANVLGRVPQNMHKKRRFQGMTRRQAADFNDALPQPLKRLSQTTVEGYLAEIRSTWRRATAAVHGVRDIGVIRATIPRTAEAAAVREGLRPPAINRWLASAVERPEPHFYWVPLVGLLTGMRLGELVYLQGRDFKKKGKHWTIDLQQDIIVKGIKKKRPLKTATSRRIVSVHDFLAEIGFVAWARQRPEFVFAGFHKAKDPADAASKRMIFWMKSLGIHTPQTEVFHALRHTTEDWLRPHVGERTANLQCGHVPGQHVGAKYGWRTLEPKEIAAIATAPLPDDVDLSAYMERKK